jgi:hypothetical protein
MSIGIVIALKFSKKITRYNRLKNKKKRYFYHTKDMKI